MRLIDADALIARCGDWYVEEGTEEGFIGTLKGIVDTLPTIDAVLVVRCKDCGHWYGYTNKIHTSMDSREWDFCQKNKKMKPEDGFCHEAERREE